MLKEEINYKGTDILEVYKLALIGADFSTEKNDNGVLIVNSFNKHLYVKSVLLSRFLNLVELPEDRLISIEQYRNNDIDIDELKGRGIKKLKKDFKIFEDMLNIEIMNLLSNNNDSINRLTEMLSMNLTPENLESVKVQLDDLMKELDKAEK